MMRLFFASFLIFSSVANAGVTVTADYFSPNKYLSTSLGYASTEEKLSPEVNLSMGKNNGGPFAGALVGLRYSPTKIGTVRGFAGETIADKSLIKSYGLDVSYWFAQEQYQLGLTVTRDLVNQPAKNYLDTDAKLVKIPARLTNLAGQLYTRILVNQNLILDGGITCTSYSNRPTRNQFDLGAKQYIQGLKAALQMSLGVAKDWRQVEQTTDYGKIQAEYADLRLLFENQPHSFGAYYRMYRETEHTRALPHDKIYGSDTYGLTYSDNANTVGAYYYESNQDVYGIYLQVQHKI